MNFEMPNQKNIEEKIKKAQKKDKEYGSESPIFPEGELDAMIEGIEGTPVVKGERALKESSFNIPENINDFKTGQRIKVGREVWEVTYINEDKEIIGYRKVGGFSKKEKEGGYTRTGDITLEALRKKIEEYNQREMGGGEERKKAERERGPKAETDKEVESKIESKKELEKLREREFKEEKRRETFREEEEKLIEDSEFLNLSREFIKEKKLELTETTLDGWKKFLEEEHYNLLVRFAKEYCEKNRLLPPKGQAVTDSYYLDVLREKGGIGVLESEQRESLAKIGALRKLVETRGPKMSISERMLLVRRAEDRIDILRREIKGKKEDSPEVIEKKNSISLIRDLQADIFSETFKGKEGEERFKTDIYKEAYEALRKEYEKEGRLELYEALRGEREIKEGRILRRFKIKGKEGKIVLSEEDLKEAREEFDRRADELYHKILEKKIKEVVGNFEAAEGGIESWYEKIKSDLIRDLLEKQKKGELRITSKEGVKVDTGGGIEREESKDLNEEEIVNKAMETFADLTGQKISKEDVNKVWDFIKRGSEKLPKEAIGALFFVLLIGGLFFMFFGPTIFEVGAGVFGLKKLDQISRQKQKK